MEWVLAIISLALIAFAVLSRRLNGTPVTAAIVFVGVGLVVGARALDLVDASPTGASVRVLAEATLTVVLFMDASRIDLRKLRQEYTLPARLLGLGLPLTIALGALLAAALFGALSIPEALILAVVLAPTDAALGQAVVTETRLPSRIRQGLNVESGLNDGICVPLLFIVLIVAEANAGDFSAAHAVRLVLEEIGWGIAGGAVAGVVTATAVRVGARRGLIEPAWLQIAPVAGAALSYGIAAPLGGSGFIAAFVAGMTFGALYRPDGSGEVTFLTEELGELLNAVTLLVFGAVLLACARQPQLADRALLGGEPHRGPDASGRGRAARHPGATSDGRVPRLVRPAWPGIDRVRRDRRAGGQASAHDHDPRDDLCHGRPIGPRPRRHRGTSRAPLRDLVRLSPLRSEAGDGERSGWLPSLASAERNPGVARAGGRRVSAEGSKRVDIVPAEPDPTEGLR